MCPHPTTKWGGWTENWASSSCYPSIFIPHKRSKTVLGEDVLTAAYLVNRYPLILFKTTVSFNCSPSFTHTLKLQITLFLESLGVSFVHVHSPHWGKLDPRAIKCIFVGYSLTQKGYKCYHPATKKVFVSIDVTFVETESFFSQLYLQGENSCMEDKDNLFKNLSFISPSKSKILESSPIHISSSSIHTPPALALSPKTTGTKKSSAVIPTSLHTKGKTYYPTCASFRF